MRTILRHTIAILLMPTVVVVGVPYWLMGAFSGADYRWSDNSFVAVMFRGAGVALILAGLALFSWCVSLFVRVGRGTLAPWDPTRNIVIEGPYRFVRNPMISGVALMLIGQALFRGSWVLGLWAGIFPGINHVYFVLSEEPGLERRFGEEYRRYKAKVPRWIPKII